jgi:hypothetical protein
MNKSNYRAMLAVAYCLAAALAPAACGQDRNEIVGQARRLYYDLKSEGLDGFGCQVRMDWDSMFKTVKPDAIGQSQVLPILKETHFKVLVGPDGASAVSHQSDVPPPSEVVAERVRSATEGFEQVVTGFFQAWSLFMMGAPFPEADGDYLFETDGEKYRLAYKEKSVDVVISMTHDLAIDEIKVTTPKLEGTLNPTFAKNKGEFVLLGYDGTYKAASGASQRVSVKIEHQDVQGFNLPATVTATTSLPASKVEMAFSFTDCQVTKR